MGTRHVGLRKRLLYTTVSCLLFFLFIEVFAEKVTNDPSVVTDFQSFYVAGYLARTAPSLLYDLGQQRRLQHTPTPLPYYHPAYEALLYAPFSLLTYRTAYRAFLLFNVCLLACIVLTLQELATTRVPLMKHFPGLALFTFIPVLLALLQGQDSILFLALCCGCWRMYQRGYNFVTGCVLGLMLFRFQLALPLLAILLLQRRRYLWKGFLSCSLLVALVSFAMVGSAGMRQWAQMLASSSLARDHGLAMQNLLAIHPQAMPNLFGLLYALGLRVVQPGHATVLVLAASAGVFLWTAWQSRKITRPADVFALALLCSMLVSYHANVYDLSLLVLPLALLRTKMAFFVGLVTYASAYGLLFVAGANLFFLLTVPVLLLCFSWKPLPQQHELSHPNANRSGSGTVAVETF